MKAVFNSIAKGLAIVLVLCIIFTTIILNSRQSVAANEAFDGINDIISNNSEENPFRVIELVPDEEMAELGYMVGGQEPVQWLNEIAYISSPLSRSQFVSSLKDKLNSITSSDKTKAIAYSDYEEAYAVADSAEWKTLNLAKSETIPSGSSGYRMDDVGPGNGNYEEQFVYNVNLDGTGEYNQNIDYYIYGSGYYGVEFKEVATDIDESGNIVTDAEKVYEAVSSVALVKESKFNEIAGSNPNAYLYRVSRSDISGAYQCVEAENNRPIKLKDIAFSDLDQTKYIYFTVEFAYVPKEEMAYSKIYYEAVKEEFYTDPTEGEYGAHLMDEAYVPATDGDGNNIGHFDRSVEAAYIYVGEEMGNYILVKDDAGSLTYPVIVDKIYYKGGFSNNEWLKYGVFNQGKYFDENENAKMYFDFKTMIPEVFSETEMLTYDLLYISGNSSINGPVDSFSKTNDISWNRVMSVVDTIQSQYFPVMVDYSILGSAVNDLANASNMQKLVALLASDNFYELNVAAESEKDAAFWKSVSISKDSDHHFVNGSIYVYPGNEYNAGDPRAPFFFKEFKSNFINEKDTAQYEKKATEAGFGEIAKYINSQNLSRKTENDALGEQKYGYFDLTVSKAIAIEYIISCVNLEETAFNDTLRVLDVEPCFVEDATNDAINGDTIKKWFTDKGYGINEVTVEHMSMPEFIGNIQDLSDFDMIYLGLSKNRLNVDGSGNTVYNDSAMNGLIYSNVGDICVVTTDHAGLLKTDYIYNGIGQRVGVKPLDDNARFDHQWSYSTANNTYRYSGNDITKEKMQDIIEYAKTGSPVVIADGFYNRNANSYQVNDYLIDNCSNMYELMGKILDYDNVMLRTAAVSSTSTLYNYVELGRPELNLVEQAKADGKEYVKLSTNKMNFQFSISNKGAVESSAKFDVSLYLDVNADGKFSNNQEHIEANDVKMYENGKFIKPVSGENGSYHYELSAGNKHNYELVYSLPESYIGIIPWKLKVNQVSNVYRYDYEQGYVYRENPGDAQKIKILQINHKSTGNSTFNMQQQLEDPNSTFSNLMRQVEDFELDITTVASDVFGNNYYEGYLDQYDMLIIGFADCYEILDKNGCVSGLKNYINEGKPVLFTHDTTSLYNSSVDTGAWGYYFNSEIRNLVGLDRYGILSSEALKEGITLTKDSWDTGKLYKQAVSFAEKNGTDLAYKPRSNKSVIVKQNQGMAYGDLVRFAANVGLDYNNYFYLKNTCSVSYATRKVSFQMRTTRVSQVNTGQITTYPFIIPEEFEVSSTHAQYYQLDMNEDADGDGESDIVVWYTLDGGGSYKNIVYGASPRDVRNNYYIYTKGNVTYSGVGHSSISGSENELKLYINTMIAAYSSGVHAPTISLKETSEEDSSKVGTIYVSFEDELDKSIEQSVAGDKPAVENIYFNVVDSNIVKNLKRKELRVDFGIPVSITEDEYKRNEDKYIQVSDQDGSAVYLKKVDVDVFKLDGEKQITYLSSGVTYRAEIPLSFLGEGDNYVEIYVVAGSKIIRYNSDGQTEGKPITTPKDYDTFRIQRIGLSNLD